MSKNIEKQGKRPGYIVGGIFALILGALLVMLYVPALISEIAGIEPIWDLSGTFESILGANFMEMFAVWGGVGILLLLGGVYFICFFARPSTASTMFRFSALFGVLSLLVPNLLTAIESTIADAADTTIDLLQYSTYAVLALFVLSFVFYVIGFVARIKQKYHKNRASTVLVFAATFWMVLSAFPALNALNTLIDGNVDFFVEAGEFVSAQYLGIIAIFLVVSAIWMFITVPHRVVVDYNPDTRKKNADGRPKLLDGDAGIPSTPFTPEPVQMKPAQAQGPTSTPQFPHNYTTPPQSSNFATNPVLNANQNNFAQNAQQRPFVASAQQPQTAPQQARPFVQPQAPQSPIINQNQNNPYASFNNFAQNSPYNRPQANANPRPVQQPQAPQTQRPVNPFTPQAPRPTMQQPPRPMQQPQQPPRPYGQPQPQAPRPANPFAQTGQPRPAPRPPVTPFTQGNQPPRPNTTPNNPNNPNGTPPASN